MRTLRKELSKQLVVSNFGKIIRPYSVVHGSVVGIIYSYQPFLSILTLEPCLYKLELVCFVVIPARDSRFSGNLLIALFKMVWVGSVNPENISLRVEIFKNITVFNGDL